jgi:hypothetical protein
VFLAFGSLGVANAAWMLIAPGHWYQELPAGVPDTGPLNPHFVRDIGCAFLAVGAAQIWAAFDRRNRLPLVSVSALFLVLHALLHVHDTLRGLLDAGHWWMDLPGVYLPAVVLLVAVFACARPNRIP